MIDRLVDRYGASYHEAVAQTHTPVDRLNALAQRTIGPQIDENNFWPLAIAELRHLPAEMVQPTVQKANDYAHTWIEPLQKLHPELNISEAEFMVTVGACLTPTLRYYQPQLSRSRLTDLLTKMLLAAYEFPDVLTQPIPDAHDHDDTVRDETGSAGWTTPIKRASARERILALALPLMRQHGFSGIGMDDIGAAVGMTGPGLYRHFKSKEDILYSALARVNEQLTMSMNRSLLHARSPADALERLVDSYLDLTISDTDLSAVYWTEKHALSDEKRGLIDRGARNYVDDWITVVTQVRTDRSDAEARTMTYGALGLMNGYWQGRVTLEPDRARIILRAMVMSALFKA
ncbi:TetR/AcrR family transcriptional regulator [Nocardia sp. NBC_00508]|uniref:TetR/AcrR family transcriptional regulator n=1 Tax=Nocardia sp. NBC_00508 TaxID=2975992 RepID=UPI002E81CCE2|nr:TetR/AcrR family transcriptional regulator [Nocardia sp. NBC_00508]WUD67103.1 TetR/AcrR family transcriptional regulator [Nocardia sp. NBC_00508]